MSDQLHIKMKPTEKVEYKQFAESVGETMTDFAKEAIRERKERLSKTLMIEKPPKSEGVSF